MLCFVCVCTCVCTGDSVDSMRLSKSDVPAESVCPSMSINRHLQLSPAAAGHNEPVPAKGSHTTSGFWQVKILPEILSISVRILAANYQIYVVECVYVC